MPAGSGIAVLEAIKRDEHPPVVVMLTSCAYPQYRKKCREAGAGYFDKSSELKRGNDVLTGMIAHESL